MNAPADRRVWVALATYNGARYIGEQIASIRQQSFSDWTLLVRDDMSRDGTLALIESAAALDPRIRILRDGRGKLGAIGNFGALMAEALKEGADYLFFSDQDDVWHPEKIAIMLGAMRELEASSPGRPLLVHSDLAVVDGSLAEISPSFMDYSKLSPDRAVPGVLLCQNQVTGCATVINRSLLEQACPVPREVLMHDWWLALLAAAAGKIAYVPMPLVSYRQHEGNVLGAVSFWRRIAQLLTSRVHWERFAEVVRGSVVQARLLAERLRERRVEVSSDTTESIDVYATILKAPRLGRVARLRRHGIGKPQRTKGWMFNLMITLLERS
ncbi:MAG: glycosyltransferase family 2 protein [Pseudomonadota bacterium]